MRIIFLLLLTVACEKAVSPAVCQNVQACIVARVNADCAGGLGVIRTRDDVLYNCPGSQEQDIDCQWNKKVASGTVDGACK